MEHRSEGWEGRLRDPQFEEVSDIADGRLQEFPRGAVGVQGRGKERWAEFGAGACCRARRSQGQGAEDATCPGGGSVNH